MCVKKKLCDVINRIAEAYRKEQSLRKSKLSIRETIHILIGAEGGSLAKELHRTGYDVSASALTQRRAQIPANVFRDIFMGFNGECVDSETFHGFRLLAVDGTAVSIPRNPKSDSFVVHSGAPKGYNQLHMTPLYDIQIYKKIFCFWNCINYGIIIFKFNKRMKTRILFKILFFNIRGIICLRKIYFLPLEGNDD